MVMPFMGSPDPQPLPEDAVKAMMAEADFDGVLVDPEAKGHEIELVGKEDVDGTETYRVRVTTSSGVVVDYFLDAEYYLPIQTITKASMQGMEMEITATISDYKEVDGLMIAHSISTANPMGTQVMNVDSVEIDVEVDPETFSMPEAEESPDAEGP